MTLDKKEYYEKNKERIRKRTKEYYQKNKEWLREYSRLYYAENRETIRKNRNKTYTHEKPKLRPEHRTKYGQLEREGRIPLPNEILCKGDCNKKIGDIKLPWPYIALPKNIYSLMQYKQRHAAPSQKNTQYFFRCPECRTTSKF